MFLGLEDALLPKLRRSLHKLRDRRPRLGFLQDAEAQGYLQTVQYILSSGVKSLILDNAKPPSQNSYPPY